MLLYDDLRKSRLRRETKIHGGIKPSRPSSVSEISGDDDRALNKMKYTDRSWHLPIRQHILSVTAQTFNWSLILALLRTPRLYSFLSRI